MCDLNPIYGVLTGVDVLLIAAIAACIVAIAANSSIFGAPGSPVAAALALGLGIAATVGLVAANVMLAGCTPDPECATLMATAQLSLAAAAASLAIGMTIAYVSVAASGVPIIGSAPLTAESIAFVVSSVALVKGIDGLHALEACEKQNSSLFTVAFVLSIFAAVGTVVGLAGIVMVFNEKH